MFSPEKSLLLVIDVQGNLAYRMQDQALLFRHIQGLIQATRLLEVPLIYTEQAPEKIGKTIPEISEFLQGYHPVIKQTFSCCGTPHFINALKTLNRKEIIVCGIEAHVCVYQTVCDLLKKNFQIQVVEDAVSSRASETRRIGINRMRDLGVGITCTEMIITELLQSSAHPQFKEVLKLIK